MGFGVSPARYLIKSFGFQGLGFRVEGSEFGLRSLPGKVPDIEFFVHGLGFMVHGSGLRVEG